MTQGCSTLYVPPADKSTWAGSSYTDAQFEAYVNAHPDLLARYNAGNRSESIAQWGRKHYAYFGANEGRSSGLVATIASAASSGSGGGGGCTPPGTAITDANFSAAITDWIASGNASEYGDITQWCTGNVTDMTSAFEDETTFNADIGNWDTSNVSTMRRMFNDASAFDQDIGSSDMFGMFYDADTFNQNIGGWNTGKVTDMRYLFANLQKFPCSTRTSAAGVSPIFHQSLRTLTMRQGLLVLRPANRSGVPVHNKPRGPSANVSLPPRSLALKETTAAWFSDMPDGQRRRAVRRHSPRSPVRCVLGVSYSGRR